MNWTCLVYSINKIELLIFIKKHVVSCKFLFFSLLFLLARFGYRKFISIFLLLFVIPYIFIRFLLATLGLFDKFFTICEVTNSRYGLPTSCFFITFLNLLVELWKGLFDLLSRAISSCSSESLRGSFWLILFCSLSSIRSLKIRCSNFTSHCFAHRWLLNIDGKCFHLHFLHQILHGSPAACYFGC